MNVSLQSTLPENLLMDSESERRVLSSMMHSEEACVEAYHALQSADFTLLKMPAYLIYFVPCLNAI